MEFENNIPIYIQVINQIKKDIITGKLPMGAKLPSTRELAVLYHINPNTAGRVYKEMELQNMCYTKRGLGTFVRIFRSTLSLNRFKNKGFEPR